jgi:hypothetical protein
MPQRAEDEGQLERVAGPERAAHERRRPGEEIGVGAGLVGALTFGEAHGGMPHGAVRLDRRPDLRRGDGLAAGPPRVAVGRDDPRRARTQELRRARLEPRLVEGAALRIEKEEELRLVAVRAHEHGHPAGEAVAYGVQRRARQHAAVRHGLEGQAAAVERGEPPSRPAGRAPLPPPTQKAREPARERGPRRPQRTAREREAEEGGAGKAPPGGGEVVQDVIGAQDRGEEHVSLDREQTIHREGAKGRGAVDPERAEHGVGDAGRDLARPHVVGGAGLKDGAVEQGPRRPGCPGAWPRSSSRRTRRRS